MRGSQYDASFKEDNSVVFCSDSKDMDITNASEYYMHMINFIFVSLMGDICSNTCCYIYLPTYNNNML